MAQWYCVRIHSRRGFEKKKKITWVTRQTQPKMGTKKCSEIKGDRMRYNHISQVSFLLLKYGASTKVTCGKARSAAVPVAMRSIWLVPGNWSFQSPFPGKNPERNPFLWENYPAMHEFRSTCENPQYSLLLQGENYVAVHELCSTCADHILCVWVLSLEHICVYGWLFLFCQVCHCSYGHTLCESHFRGIFKVRSVYTGHPSVSFLSEKTRQSNCYPIITGEGWFLPHPTPPTTPTG